MPENDFTFHFNADFETLPVDITMDRDDWVTFFVGLDEEMTNLMMSELTKITTAWNEAMNIKAEMGETAH